MNLKALNIFNGKPAYLLNKLCVIEVLSLIGLIHSSSILTNTVSSLSLFGRLLYNFDCVTLIVYHIPGVKRAKSINNLLHTAQLRLKSRGKWQHQLCLERKEYKRFKGW